jgi:hypothetical protein
MKKCLFTLIVLTLSPLAAADPAWWSAPETKIWSDVSVNAENQAPINVGQLKFVAAQAKKYLDTSLAAVGGAGPEVSALVYSFTNKENNSFANVGQLKAVCDTFYTRLAQVKYPMNAWLSAQGLTSIQYDTSLTTNPAQLPWKASDKLLANSAPANIGQLKLIFSFDLQHQQWLTRDTDGDTYADFIEVFHGTSPTLTTTNSAQGTDQAYLAARLARDADGDGLADYLETTAATSRRDFDLDGQSDLVEYGLSSDRTRLPSVTNASTSLGGTIKLLVFRP